MKEYKFLYEQSYKYSNITEYENYIVLTDRRKSFQTSYSREEVISKITSYGEDLYRILKERSFYDIKDLNVEDINSIKQIFFDYYKNIGYAKNNTDDKIVDDYKIVYVHLNTIMALKNNFIKFYILYTLYEMLDFIPLKPLDLKKANNYVKILNPNFKDLTSNNSTCLYGEVMNLISEQFNYPLRLQFKLVKDDFIKFDVVSKDIYALCLYAFSDILSLNELHKPLIFTCKNCNKQFIRNSNSQKYCPNCKDKISYSKNLDIHKLEVIKQILYYKKEENYYHYWNADFKHKFDEIVSLENKSRERLKTNIKDLKIFLQDVLEKVKLNKHGYRE